VTAETEGTKSSSASATNLLAKSTGFVLFLAAV